MDERRPTAGARTARVIPFRAAIAGRRSAEPAHDSLRPLSGAGATVHALSVPTSSPAAPSRRPDTQVGLRPDPRGALDLLRDRLLGNYPVDDFGFDQQLTEEFVLPLFRPLYERWFRVEVGGVTNIPDTGGALLVANHAGGIWPADAIMTAVAVHDEHPAGRFLRMLGADLVFGTPGLGALARKSGSTLACTEDAARLLDAGELVGVWPEGFKGIGKPFRERYKLQRFGRGGFVHAALRAGVPIVPVSIVGAEEIHPVLGTSRTLARLTGLPYFPITATFPLLGPLGLIPLPSKWYIEFGEPIPTDGLGPETPGDPIDPVAVFDLTDRVRETIQSTLYRLLEQRRSVWR